jgi:hypothetical protein
VNTTEERLADALKTTGATLGPEDIPELDLSAARRPAVRRPVMILAAAAAVTAVVAGGAYLAQQDDGKQVRPLGQPGAVPGTVPGKPAKHVAVYLCETTSSNPTCQKRRATAQQRRDIDTALQAMPGVEEVDYESHQQAFERFKEKFAGTPGFDSGTGPGDVPDSFRVTPRRPEDAAKIMSSMVGRPGVDKVVIER